jgi:hypothetical protein
MPGRDEAVDAQKASCACENGIFIAGLGRLKSVSKTMPLAFRFTS